MIPAVHVLLLPVEGASTATVGVVVVIQKISRGTSSILQLHRDDLWYSLVRVSELNLNDPKSFSAAHMAMLRDQYRLDGRSLYIKC
jgi:hypothetical protein